MCAYLWGESSGDVGGRREVEEGAEGTQGTGGHSRQTGMLVPQGDHRTGQGGEIHLGREERGKGGGEGGLGEGKGGQERGVGKEGEEKRGGGKGWGGG